MKRITNSLMALAIASLGFLATAQAQQTSIVTVTIENMAPENGVVLTPVWVGFHNGSFDSYNAGLTALEGLERVAEDGDNVLISKQFLDFNPSRGGYTYVDNSNPAKPKSKLVRTGDLNDQFRQDATLTSETGPVQPGQVAMSSFELRNDGSNDFFSYASMVLPTNDFFVANGNQLAHDISPILGSEGGEISFFIGTPNQGTNDAGTEAETFNFSAGNALFPGRNLPPGQTRPNQGPRTKNPIASVVGDPFTNFQLISFRDQIRLRFFTRSINRLIRFFSRFSFIRGVDALIERLEQAIADLEASVTIDVDGFDFNQYENGIARVTITAVPVPDVGFATMVPLTIVKDADAEEAGTFAVTAEEFVSEAAAGNLYFNIHTAQFPGGEIRGQLDVVSDVNLLGLVRVIKLESLLDAAQEPGPLSDSEATGMAKTLVISTPAGVAYSSMLSVDGIAVEDLIPVAIFSAIHIHNAPRGVNGPVVRDYIVDAGGTPEDFSILSTN